MTDCQNLDTCNHYLSINLCQLLSMLSSSVKAVKMVKMTGHYMYLDMTLTLSNSGLTGAVFCIKGVHFTCNSFSHNIHLVKSQIPLLYKSIVINSKEVQEVLDKELLKPIQVK